MALGVSATMAFLLLSFLVALSDCGALQANNATNASSSYRVVVPAEVHTVQDAKEFLRLPSSVAEPDPDRSLVEPVAEPDPDRSPVKPVAEPDPDRSPVESVAEPDPDRSHPDSDELATKKPCSEGQQGYEKVKEQIDEEDKEKEEKEKEKANKKREGKKKTKKHDDGDDKGKKEKKHNRQSDDEDKEEEDTNKRIHRHHRAGDTSKKKNKLSHHIKNNNDDDGRGGGGKDGEAVEEGHQEKVRPWPPLPTRGGREGEGEQLVLYMASTFSTS